MLFAKKEMDVTAAKRFWAWFEELEGWMIENLRSHGMDVVWAIDAQIKPVFPYFKKELEFQLGFNNGKGEFFFFHFGDKHLIRDAETLASMMPENLKDRWTFIAER
jgi:hypothetical protein